MDVFIRITCVLVKLTFKILKGVLRAIFETCFAAAVVVAVVASGLIISYVIIKYGDCDDPQCLTFFSAGSVVMVVGWSLGFYVVYTYIKDFL